MDIRLLNRQWVF